MDLLIYVFFIIGFLLIIKGGDWFVDAASWIAKVTGMPDVLIGATIVSIGTALPELFVAITSAFEGHSDMSLGNAIGSTICNIGLVLGLCNLIAPSKIDIHTFSIKAIMMICYTAGLLFMILDGEISSFESALLMLGLIIYIIINYLEVRAKNKENKSTSNKMYIAITIKEISSNIFKFIIGAIFIIFGARLLVDNGIKISTMLNVPDIVISLTIIALGTSLPELVTSVTALIKGNRNLAIGNVIGSNILNITMVAGIPSIIQHISVPFENVKLDFTFSLLLMTMLILPAILYKKINRLLGGILLTIYFAYLFIIFSSNML